MLAHTRTPLFIAMWILCACTMLACTTDPAATKARHIANAERYAAEKKYPEAVIELRNALKIDPTDAQANYRLAVAYLSQNPAVYAQQAVAALSVAIEHDPDLLDAHLRLGELLTLGGQHEEAKRRAEAILERDSTHLGGLVLLARAEAALGRLSEARNAVAAAKSAHPEASSPWLAEATIDMRAQEPEAAVQALKEAERLAPQDIDPLLSLANVYRSMGRIADAEAQYQLLIQRHPENASLQLVLAQFHALNGDAQRANDAFEQVVEAFPDDVTVRMTYGDYLLGRGQRDAAVEQYQEVVASHPRETEAKMRLVSVFLSQRKVADARALVTELQGDRRGDPDVLYLHARTLLLEHDPDAAASALQSAIQADPNHAASYVALGRIYAMRGDIAQAKTALTDAIRVNPSGVDARLALAEVHLRSGAPDLALEQSRTVLATSPRNALALRVTGDAFAATGKPGDALKYYDQLIEAAPSSPAGYLRKGFVYQAQRKDRDAERHYRLALERNPGSSEVLDPLVTVLMRGNRSTEAIQLVREQLVLAERKAPLYQIMGSIYMVINETSDAEAHFRRAIEEDAGFLPGYESLARLYSRTHEPEKVLAQYQAMVKAAPNNAPAHMLLGMAYQSDGRSDEAIRHYERALQINPRFAPAANNLAWLYLEGQGNIDVALSLAQTALQEYPDHPGIADTLGWIYYKKGLFHKAITHLRDSAEKLPDNPTVHYHLGMAYYRNGDMTSARQALTKALSLEASFSGRDEASDTLAAITASERRAE